ncbi:M20 family metallo-hydrolase (plasmid) [Erwinia sp. INIA-01]|uniref:M20 family metallo-hydrolase n=1 Tax=Erwinia sp. INIA01 TaxID=2991500 RepID=UPI0022251803|nr:M20 family metallo-hydrolase [Erwinia sp. INIA01]MCW1873154.1 M20 family metallo-hydrolase [Erwinia sp. INIA01]
MIINAERLWQRLMRMAQIGTIAGDGVNRQALSAEEAASWRLMIDWAQASDLEVRRDAAGNLFVILPGTDRRAAPLLLGSHLDSQPTGGRFDGVYGVLAALEVLTVFRERGLQPACDVVAVSWMNEEGSRFAPGMMGSSLFAGARALSAVRAVTDEAGCSVGQALDALHRAVPLALYACPHPPAAYLEVHIEQATQLERAGATIGVVSGIQGKVTWQVTLRGERGHAGTVPMAQRRDVLRSFTGIAQRLYEEVGEADLAVMLTIGRIEMQPNAPSVIPDGLTFRIDLRHPDAGQLTALTATAERLMNEMASPCDIEFTRLSEAAPNAFSPELQQAIATSAGERGYPALSVLSAAGHDARYLAAICPSAMIFIPCRAGISHAPEEWAEPEAVSAGAQVLLDVARRWSGLQHFGHRF